MVFGMFGLGRKGRRRLARMRAYEREPDQKLAADPEAMKKIAETQKKHNEARNAFIKARLEYLKASGLDGGGMWGMGLGMGGYK